MKLYSFNLLGPHSVDSASPDKLYPPAYRTVQNRQPIPEGSLQKRNGISAESIVTGTSHKETQLVSYIYLKGGPDTTAVAAVSDRGSTTTFMKWNGTAWVAFSSALTNDTVNGVYYVANVLDTTAGSVATKLFVAKYNSSPSSTGTPPYGNPCVYAIADDYGVTKFDGSQIIPGTAGNVWTGNWKSAYCCEYHLGKMWVGGLVECDLTATATDSNEELDAAVDADPTTTTINVTPDSGTAKISAGTVIRVPPTGETALGDNDEEMAVISRSANQLTVVRAINNTTISVHDDTTTVFHYVNATERPYRIRWSKTFDWQTDFDGLGAGSFESPGSNYMDIPTIGTHSVVGMRSFRGNLYVLTTSDLFVITGKTTAQFGLTKILSTPSAIGPTFWASDRYLFWVDANGLHQFNGSQERNLSEKHMPVAFKALNVEGYSITGVGVAGRLPTAFINEKLKIYGVHFPYVSSDVPGKVTWLYNYDRDTITTYTYDYLEAGTSDITYVSDYHDNGSIWVGTSNAASDAAVAGGGKYVFEPVIADPQDWGSKAITTILETGDINLAAEQGLSYEDAAILHRIDLYCVPDPDVDVTYQLDLTVDNETTASQTVTVDKGSDTQPTLAMMPLPALKTGSFFKFKITEATNGARGDLRKVDIFYDIRAIRGATR
jgi:hypothetical protein